MAKGCFFGGFFCLFILRVFEQSLMFSDATGGQQLQTTAEDTSWTFSCSQASRSVEIVGKNAHFQQLTAHLASYSWKDCATPPKASELAVCRLHPINASLLAGVSSSSPTHTHTSHPPPPPSPSVCCLSASLPFHSAVFWYFLKETTMQWGQTEATKMRPMLVHADTKQECFSLHQ